MAKNKDPFDELFKNLTPKQMQALLSAFKGGRSIVDAAEYPYVKNHPTLLVSEVAPKAYHLYITLEKSPVKIYRRLTVPSNLRLEHLAEIIIIAMGWENYHLHQFIVSGEYFMNPKEAEEDDGFLSVSHDAMSCIIGDVLNEKGKHIKFEYDFGDGWMHKVRLSSIGEFNGEPYVSVDSGSGECPPEDIGGVYGYAAYIEENGGDYTAFDLADAQFGVAAYVHSVKATEQEYKGRKTVKTEDNKKPVSGKSPKKAKIVRLLPYTFTVADIRRMHPQGLKPSPTDQEYALLANRIEREIVENAVADFTDQRAIKAIMPRVIMYYEDIIADAGMWRGFTDKMKELYGKPLPFYTLDDEYLPDEPHVEDLRLLVWDAMRDVRPFGRVPNPENFGIEKVANIIYGILDEEFENVGINENLADYFKKADFASDFYEMRDVLNWIYFDCYLTTDAFASEIQGDITGQLSHYFKGKELSYESECVVPLQVKVGMLALYPKDWLALFVGSKGNGKAAEQIAAIETTDILDILKKTASDDKCVSFIDVEGRDIVLERGKDYEISEKELREGTGAVGSYVKYCGKWYLNGHELWGNVDKLFDDTKKTMEPKENINVHNYDHLMELSGGSPLFYFKNMTEYKTFLASEAGWTKEDIKTLSQFGNPKNIAVFMQGPDKPFAICPGAAIAICDKRNPYYNSRKAVEEGLALGMVTNGETIPGVFARYLIEHHMLPDAALNSMLGAEHGRQLLQDNIDFLARAFRRDHY